MSEMIADAMRVAVAAKSKVARILGQVTVGAAVGKNQGIYRNRQLSVLEAKSSDTLDVETISFENLYFDCYELLNN